MQLTDATPKAAFKFKGYDINVAQPFTEGQTLDANLTKFINRQLASVTGNIFASAVNRLLAKAQEAENEKAKTENRAAKTLALTDALSAADAQAMFDKIMADYEPGVQSERGEGIARDPVETLANNIAWERIKQRLKAKNIKVNSVSTEKRAEFIKQLREKDPSILVQAKAAVGGEAPTDGLDDLLGDLGNETTAGADTTSGEAGTDQPQGEPAPDAVVTDPTAAPAEVAPNAAEGEATPSGGAFA